MLEMLSHLKTLLPTIGETISPPLCRWLLACLKRSEASSRKNLLPVWLSPPASALLVALLQFWIVQSSQEVYSGGLTTERATFFFSCLPGADRNVKLPLVLTKYHFRPKKRQLLLLAFHVLMRCHRSSVIEIRTFPLG